MIKTYLFTLISVILCNSYDSFAQGCVAIRGNSTCIGKSGNSINLTKGEFNVQLSGRHFKSFRHFRGDHEETNRVSDGTEVINKSTFIDFSISYGITNRLFASAILPFAFHNRSSMYEHGGNPPNGLGDRHVTTSKGLSDIRVGIGYWLFNPQKHKYNYSVGVGLKLPSGNYNTKDTFYNQGTSKNESKYMVVDQSIQLGDGGLGVAFDIQGYHPLSTHFGITTNLFYLINSSEKNGVLTRDGVNQFSCPDQYAIRIGGFYNTMIGINAFLGARLEGVPSKDIFGGSDGFRRPGYVISTEPGAGYFKKQYSFFISMPISLYRNRTQSYLDKVKTEQTGVYTIGDAAFANYSVNVGISYRFGGHKNKHSSMSDIKLDNINNSK